MQDLNDKVTGNSLTATEWNEVPSELQNVIEALGITLSSGDLNQLGKAIAGYVANGSFYTDSGAADAYVLSAIGSKQTPPAYTDGLKVSFIVGNTNTGASTVNVAGLGVKNIRKESAITVLDAGDLVAGSAYDLVFDSGVDAFDVVLAGPRENIFTASGSYSKPIGLKSVKVTVIGAGAGAGSSTASTIRGGGGGAGATAIRYLSASQLLASETVTIGAGGTGGLGSGASGTSGGNSSLGVLVVANGGGLGAGGAGSEAGGAGGTAMTGDILVNGGFGSDGGNSANGGSGDGGNSSFGASGRSGSPTGANGGGAGAGGGGGINAAQAGNGSDGIIIIEEFF